MRLQNGSGDHLSVAIVSYEFPGMTEERFDANWLNIEGEVSLAGRSWRFREPCFLTFEVAELARWLNSVAAGKVPEEDFEPIEPLLHFRRLSDGGIRIFFELEARPDWAPSDGMEMEDLWLDVEFDAAAFREAAEMLNGRLQSFPER